MKQIDHIGIAVNDIESSEGLYSRIMGVQPFHREVVQGQNIRVSFLQLGSTKVELLNPLSDEGGVHRFLKGRGEGIHHVAFSVEDIYMEIERMKAEGFRPLTDKPFIGALKKLVIFFHPKDANGVLVEFCQNMDGRDRFQ